ncbi:MFS transporter (macronuclear) [Tetrahymena thermophila SB210]|uniref:MFS transporter n=1 Tax=Tetrahymena thermophila (strain SB210) TaxID=312017 RepID=Q22Z45_TETTS|nr:MFS transporter [Tetrahymena thermophila SB210]EAR90476.2 MFS transporter [Tetrahymena thermophila SB210]|eukprot:XP_001010721.2 MFS transporter [Tetrahymena thermophila SB210]
MDEQDQKKSQKRLKYYRCLIFGLTFFGYATLHCARQSWSLMKANMESDSDISSTFLGYMDFAFLMSYSIGLATLGHYGDRMDLKYFTTIGMLCAVVCLMVVGILQTTGAVEGTTREVVFIIFWILNGLSQSTAMPGFVAAMGNWFGKKKRGLIMGFWIGTTNFGDIMGYTLGCVMSAGLNIQWGYVPIASATLIFIMVVNLFLFMKPYPEKIGIDAQAEWGSIMDDETKTEQQAQQELLKKFNSSLFSSVFSQKQPSNLSTDQDRTPVNFFNAWLIPNVAIYALLFSGLKSTVYCILFWLPTLLSTGGNHVSMVNKSVVCSLFDIGIFIGGMIVGQVTDRIRKRAVLMGPSILFSVGLMIVCLILNTDSPLANSILFFFIGIFLGGPYNVCQSAIMIDLAKQKALKNSADALSTVTSLIGKSIIAQLNLKQINPLVFQSHLNKQTNKQRIILNFNILSCFKQTIYLINFFDNLILIFKSQKMELELVLQPLLNLQSHMQVLVMYFGYSQVLLQFPQSYYLLQHSKMQLVCQEDNKEKNNITTTQKLILVRYYQKIVMMNNQYKINENIFQQKTSLQLKIQIDIYTEIHTYNLNFKDQFAYIILFYFSIQFITNYTKQINNQKLTNQLTSKLNICFLQIVSYNWMQILIQIKYSVYYKISKIQKVIYIYQPLYFILKGHFFQNNLGVRSLNQCGITVYTNHKQANQIMNQQLRVILFYTQKNKDNNQYLLNEILITELINQKKNQYYYKYSFLLLYNLI